MAEREKWYCLQNLFANHSYEVRVSYAATTPADFHIELYTLENMASIYNVSFGGNGSVGKHVYGAQDNRLVTMYARVSAVYSGMSTAAANMENHRIPYRFVLEKHVLGLPYQALKLIAAIVAVLVVSFAVVVPRLLTALNAVIAETNQKSKQE
ncbi:hypothetical protein FB645_005113 [Coemansia sp. IMI 203386]|nr:hypothetical protein FB645_005113 [Coemansia sp. IMI 203386]